MKKHIFILSLLIFSWNCGSKPEISFDKTKHDFGIIKIKSQPEHIFPFKNTGTSELRLEKFKFG